MNYKLRIALVIVISCLPGLLLFNSCTESAVVSEPKAVIIDQLFTLDPNPLFTEQVTGLLTGAGFKVDIYKGDEVTVDLLRGIADSGYRLIIFRAHAGLLASEDKTISKTCVFTNESYSSSKHITEQLGEKLAKARINSDYPWVFAAGADFVSRSMPGKFDRSMVIMMGCSTLYIDDLAKSFVNKGASVYLGWDASVGLEYVDETTLILLKKLVAEKAVVGDAVASTLKEAGHDPDFGAVLKYYPPDGGKQTVAELAKK